MPNGRVVGSTIVEFGPPTSGFWRGLRNFFSRIRDTRPRFRVPLYMRRPPTLALRQSPCPAISSARRKETALEDTATISAETQGDMGESDVLTYIEDHFGDLIRNVRYLSAEHQELLVSYCIILRPSQQ
jgi:hypothetical protein